MEKKTIGGLIAALRRANGMTQRQLAERLHVSDKTVSRWERDDGAPDLSMIPVIAEVFGVTCDELLRGERRPAGAQAVSGESLPTQKGERERRRLLQVSLSRYQSRSLIAACLSLAGLLAAMALNFGFSRAYLGFLAGCVFYLAGAVCQAIFVNHAFLSVAGEEEAGAFKGRVIALAEGVWCLTAALFGGSLPLMGLAFDGYAGLGGDSWLLYGTVYGLIFLAASAVACWLVNDRLVKKGVYSPRANFAHNHRLQKGCALALAAVAAVTWTGQWVFNQFIWGPDFIEPLVFNDVQSFQDFMARETDYAGYSSGGLTAGEEAAPPNSIYYDETGSVVSEEEAFAVKVYDQQGNMLFTYQDRNETVAFIRHFPQEDGSIIIHAYTQDAERRAYATHNLVNNLFGMAYAAEAAVVLLVYLKKRKRG